ncbi:MAG TPA: hypothetical protein VGK27_09800 [Candidatus Deferrimicrobiaceae bacterium]|jgi:hypothetical protein
MMKPRLAVVLLLLTVMVLLFGWRFAKDTSVRQADVLTREAGRLFHDWRLQPMPATAAVDAEAAVNRASAIIGRRVVLPRDAVFAYAVVSSEKTGARKAAAVRFLADNEAFLLLVVSQGGTLGQGLATPPSPFPGAFFLSGVREGVSFVLWKRDALFYCLVSDRDMTRVFDLVRRHFQ